MLDINDLFDQIRRFVEEKDEAIGIQMDQIAELEEKVEELEAEIARLREENERLKAGARS